MEQKARSSIIGTPLVHYGPLWDAALEERAKGFGADSFGHRADGFESHLLLPAVTHQNSHRRFGGFQYWENKLLRQQLHRYIES